MPNFTPPNPYLVADSAWLIGKEAQATPGTPATAFVTMATKEFQPKDVTTWLKNETLHASAGTLFGVAPGPIWAEHQVPESPVFADTIGHILLNFWGDYTTTGTAASPSTTTNGSLTAGAASVTVTSGTGFASNQWIQIDTGTLAEVVQVASVAGAVLTLATTTPVRFAHATAAAVTNTTGPYTHTFSQLNFSSSTGITSSQPPTHTLIHRTGLPGSGNFYATQYAYAQFHELTLMGTAENAFVTWSGKATSWSRTYPSSTVTPSFGAVTPWPAWESTNTIASSQVKDIDKWQLTFGRKIKPVPAANGQQAPYGIFRGPVDTAKFDLKWNPAVDETALNYQINNTQPTLAWAVTNGGSGASLYSLTVNAQIGAFEDAPVTAMQDVWGYQATGELVQSTAMAGNSGGFGPCQVVLVNQTPTY